MLESVIFTEIFDMGNVCVCVCVFNEIIVILFLAKKDGRY